MTRVDWSDYLATGNDIVDRQHQALFELFNELHDAIGDGLEGEQIDDIIARLREYTLFHFTSEEDLMATNGYPAERVIEHIRAHRELSTRVDEIVEKRDRGDLPAIQALTVLLYEWLNKHIEEVDRKLADFLQA